MGRTARRSKEEIDNLYKEARKKILGGAPVRATLDEVGINDPEYYKRLKEEGGKKATKKAAKKKVVKPKKVSTSKPAISFEAIDVAQPGSKAKTMVIVTDDATTVQNILLAAFGRGA